LINEALPCSFLIRISALSAEAEVEDETDLNVCEGENAEFVRIAHVPASTESLLAEREESGERSEVDETICGAVFDQ